MAASHSDVWQHATVVENIALTGSIRRLVLALSLPAPVKPGAHIDVRVAIDGETDRRSYSIVESWGDGARIAISVFDSAGSRGGAAAMHALAEGDVLEVTQPLLDFPLRIGAAHYVLLAGGIGITAILGMARQLRLLHLDYTLVYAGRSRAAMAYIDALADEHGDRLALHIGDEQTSLVVDDLVAGMQPGTELYMCGPIRLMDAVRRAWVAHDLDAPNLRFETFGNSGWHDAEEFTVRIPRLNIEARVGPRQSMLEALESAGADMMFDCRKGECGLCEVLVLDLDGDIDHRDVFYSERQKDARGKICCCVSRVVAGGNGRGVVTIETS